MPAVCVCVCACVYTMGKPGSKLKLPILNTASDEVCVFVCDQRRLPACVCVCVCVFVCVCVCVCVSIQWKARIKAKTSYSLI